MIRLLPLLILSLVAPAALLAGADAPTPLAAEESSPLDTEFVYEAHVKIAAPVELGETPKGKRRYIPIVGGRFEGKRMKGVVLPGGADWQTERSDGVTELDALYSMRCDDGTVIIVRNRGLISENGAYFRTVPSFEAPEGPYSWLDDYVYFGTVSWTDEPNTVVIRVYRVR